MSPSKYESLKRKKSASMAAAERKRQLLAKHEAKLLEKAQKRAQLGLEQPQGLPEP